MQVQPYLFFNGHCEAAATFYREKLGAQITSVLRFNEMPPVEGAPGVTPGNEEKIMHMSLQIGETTILISDGMCDGNPKFEGFSLTLTVADDAEARRLFDLLSDGGQVHMPLGPTFFSPCFGMVADQFGVSWIVIAQQ